MALPPTHLYIGLMSGTSLDGVDAVLAELGEPAERGHGHFRALHHASAPLGEALRSELLALNTPGADEIHRSALAAQSLARVYADLVQRLLAERGLPAQAIRALGAHGQTVRHQPAQGYTVQLLNGALLAELTGIDVVCDFRSRDVAAGGQGAPLVPAFHQHLFGRPDRCVAVLNLGGIGNLSLLQPGQAVLGFDCGPANALMDAWCERHLGQPFDDGGAWAASGQVHAALMERLCAEPFLALAAPKSTGRERFNMTWLEGHLQALSSGTRGVSPDAADVQATLTAYSAHCALLHLQRLMPDVRELVVCGGGAFNATLMQHLKTGLPGASVVMSDARGLPAQQVEAGAFAWLAHRCLTRQSGSLETVTGARGARVLGAVYPAG